MPNIHLNPSLFEKVQSGEKTMSKVFISYAHKDKNIVEKIVSKIEENGHDIWIDDGKLDPAAAINEKIQLAIQDSDYVIVFLSKSSVKSKWVQQEVYEALYQELKNEKTKLIPLKIEDCDLPKAFTKTKKFSRLYIDFLTDKKASESQLIEILKKGPTEIFVGENYAVLHIPQTGWDIYLTGDTTTPEQWCLNPELKFFETVNSYLLFGFDVIPKTKFKNFVLCNLDDTDPVSDKLGTTKYISGGNGSYDHEFDKQRMWFLVPNGYEFSNYKVEISKNNNKWLQKENGT